MAKAVGLSLGARILLQLPRSQLAQLLARLVHRGTARILLALLLLLGRLATLHRFVLVAQAILLELEDVGKVFGVRAAAPTSAPAAPALLLKLDFAEHGLGAPKFGERLLLVCDRAALGGRNELRFGRVHLRHGARKNLRDFPEARVLRGNAAGHEPLGKRRRFFLEFLLGEPHRRDVFGERPCVERRRVARQVERCGNHFTLLFREAARTLLRPATTAAAASLPLPIIHVVATHGEEVHIGARRPRARHDVVVGGLGVVRDLVPGLELHVLEHERVSCSHLTQGAGRRREKRHGAFVGAVDREGELELRDAVIVLGLGVGVHLVDRERLHVAAGAANGHRRFAIRERVNRVVERRADRAAIGALEFNLVEARLGDPHHPDELAARCRRKRKGIAAIHDQAAALARHGWRHFHAHHRAGERGDVAGAVHLPVGELRVRRVTVFEVHISDIRNRRDVERERWRANPGGLHGVLRRDADVKQPERPATGGVGRHVEASPARRARTLHQQLDALRREAVQRGCDELVTALCDRGVAGRDANGEHIPGVAAGPRRQEDLRAGA